MYNGLSLTERVEQTKLTNTENTIITTVLSNMQDAAFFNGAELAALCGVSPSLVTRLIQKLGYNNFNDFKKELQDLYKQGNNPYDTFQKHLTNDHNGSGLIHQSIVQDIENLIEIEALNSEQDFDNIIEDIRKAKQVYLIGMFASASPAQILAYYLDRLEVPCRCFFGLGLSKNLEYRLPQEGDLIIAFSSQGILKEVYEAAGLAKKNGAKVVAITDSKINPLARIADHTLVGPVNGAIFDYSHVATLAVVNILANKLASTYDADYLSARLEQVRVRWKERNLFVNNR